MTTATLSSPIKTEDRPPLAERLGSRSVAEKHPLLLLSNDERFRQNLLAAATENGMRLIRMPATADAPGQLRILKPAAVLLDLDPPSETAWDTADLLAQDEHCPLLLLLTSHGEQLDFKAAIEAGSLIDKAVNAASLIEFVNLKQDSSNSDPQDLNTAKRTVIRWLKPCNWSPQVIPLRRFWGINE